MKIEQYQEISKYLHHTSDCQHHTGHDCSCGLKELRADNPMLPKPVQGTVEYLDYFEVEKYLKQVKGLDLDKNVWPYLVEMGFKNDGYFWCPPVDDDYMGGLDEALIADLKALYSEFPNTNGHWFYVSW